VAQFHFKLDPVLRQRKHVEELRQRDFAAAQAEVTRLQALLKDLDATVRTATNDMRDNRLVGRLDLSFIAAHRRFTFAMGRKALELAQQIAAAQQIADKARAALVEATKQRKIIEKLREKQFERWRADLATKETAALDEVGMQLTQRNLDEETAEQPQPQPEEAQAS
jgi:flagellar protein FliJ